MKTFKGNIILVKTDTVVVEIERKITSRFYKKQLIRTKKYQVDRNGKEVNVGDVVSIAETKPISKNKHFKLMEVNKKWYSLEAF